MKRMLCLLLVCVSFLFFVNSASADLVDLSTFTSDTVGVTEAGGVVSFDELTGPLDDMYFYDDSFYVSGPNLTFDYSLTVTPYSEDYLLVAINYDNGNLYEFEVGGYNDSLDNLIFSGSGFIDLSSYIGDTISLTFGFEYVDDYFDSKGNFSNISVPEPATMLLLGSGLIGLLGLGRRRIFKKS